jgi:hypothetical protein
MLTMARARYVKRVLSSWVKISFPTAMPMILVAGKFGLIYVLTH